MNRTKVKEGRIIDFEKHGETSPDWPTNYHEPDFWEALGRTIATISFLEEILKKFRRNLDEI